jgi:hypothetical protein
MISRSRSDEARDGRRILVTLARETGYKLKELHGLLKRDDTVISRIYGEERSERGETMLKKARKELLAYLQA